MHFIITDPSLMETCQTVNTTLRFLLLFVLSADQHCTTFNANFPVLTWTITMRSNHIAYESGHVNTATLLKPESITGPIHYCKCWIGVDPRRVGCLKCDQDAHPGVLSKGSNAWNARIMKQLELRLIQPQWQEIGEWTGAFWQVQQIFVQWRWWWWWQWCWWWWCSHIIRHVSALIVAAFCWGLCSHNFLIISGCPLAKRLDNMSTLMIFHMEVMSCQLWNPDKALDQAIYRRQAWLSDSLTTGWKFWWRSTRNDTQSEVNVLSIW